MKVKSATLLVLAATLLWGGTPAIMKLTLREVPIFSLAFIRMFFASLILGAIVWRRLKIDRVDLGGFIMAALSGITFNLAFFFMGLKLAPAINAALLIAAVPIFTLIGAHFYLKEKLSRRLTISTIVALIGVISIVGFPQGSVGIMQIIGNILLLGSALAWVFYEIFTKKLLKKYDPATVTFYSMGIGAVTFFPFALFEYLQAPEWVFGLTASGILGLLYGIFGASLLAYWAWQKGLAKLGATEASFFFYVDPISGAILAIILLGEKLTPQLIFGGALITIAVFLVEYHRKKHPLYSK